MTNRLEIFLNDLGLITLATYGFVTKVFRQSNGVSKMHYNDAMAIEPGNVSLRNLFQIYI
jgi:hypothetical protein